MRVDRDYAKYCAVIPMLSGGDDEDHVNHLKQKCLIVSNIANKLAPIMDVGTMCESFTQNWWKRIKNADLSIVEEMKFDVNSDTGKVTISNSVGHTHSSHKSSIPKAVDMDMLTNLKVYQYTHNTEYYCESANDLIVRRIYHSPFFQANRLLYPNRYFFIP